MTQLWTPAGTERTVPEWFRKRLESIDAALIVYFNPIRQRWVIDRCIRPDGTLHSHDASCPKTNVRVVQDEGKYMPLCDEVLEWFQKNDVGAEFVSPEAYVEHLSRIDRDNREKMKQARREDVVNARKDNKRQIAQFKTLIDRHDMRPNK